MKIEKAFKRGKDRVFTLRIDDNVMKMVDDLAGKNGISRQKLIEAIIRQAMKDPTFVVKIE